VTRLPIPQSTVKHLYGSATTCAYPSCNEPLMRWLDGVNTPILNSRIAHIRAASKLGPRYEKDMTDEDRREFKNLILLCLPHAEEIDLKAFEDRYPASTLTEWKTVQLQTSPPIPIELPEGLLERATVLSMGDVLMDFREATIDLGGKSATAPGSGGSGGGAIGPGSRGGAGGDGGYRLEFTVNGAEVLDAIPVEIGRGGRGGIDGMPGEAGGHTRFGTIVIPGAGRSTHTPFPAALADAISSSIPSVILANHAEYSNGLSYLSGAGWGSYDVTELPAPFRGVLCLWIDLSWTDIEPGTEVPIEVIAELITPSRTATVSEKRSTTIKLHEESGFCRMPFALPLNGTLHEAGLHILDASCNTGVQLGQYLRVRLKNRSASGFN
jgi:hypothetical protein